jgi:polar amino acid transport system substrate-binding protein
VKNRKISAFAASEILLTSFLCEENDVKGELHLLPPLKQEQWAIGLRQKDEWLKEALDKALIQLEESGEAQKVWDKWFGATSAFKLQRQFQISKIKVLE